MLKALALSFFTVSLSFAAAASAQCRDETGEPTPCPPASTSPVLVVPVEVAQPVEPEEPPKPPTVYDRAGAYVEWGPQFQILDLSPLHLTPEDPTALPAIVRDVMVHGEAGPRDVGVGGISLIAGARPVSFLRFPELRFSVLGGDVAQPLSQIGADVMGQVTSVVVLRAEIGAGLEAHAGPVGFFATGRLGIAGYFASAHLEHPTLGDFGRAQLAEDALEIGWELAMSWDVVPGFSMMGTVEGVHLGAEGIGSSFRIRITY